jgi:hypothetical protein
MHPRGGQSSSLVGQRSSLVSHSLPQGAKLQPYLGDKTTPQGAKLQPYLGAKLQPYLGAELQPYLGAKLQP